MKAVKAAKQRTKARATNWRETFIPHSIGWKSITCIDTDKTYTVETLDAVRSRLARLRLRSPVVAGIGERIALLTVGRGGLLPMPETSSEEWNAQARAFWARFSRSCDVRGRLTLEQIQRLAVSTRPILGGVFVHLLANGKIELIEPERIRDPQDAKKRANYVNGLKLNPQTGAIEAYCAHTRDEMGGFSGKHEEQEIPARDMLAVTAPIWRPDQLRELPDLAACEAMLYDLDDLNRRVIKTARAQSGMIGTMTASHPITAAKLQSRKAAGGDTERNVFEFDWGLLLKGQGGEEIKLLSSPTPSQNYAPHVKLQYTLIGAALGIPYEVLMLDMSDLTFSGAKTVLLQAQNAMQVWRTWVIERLLLPLWRWRIARAIAEKELPPAPITADGVSEWDAVRWYCVEPLWSDRDDETRANLYALQIAATNPDDLAASQGVNARRNVERLARFLVYVREVAEKYNVDASELFRVIIPGQNIRQQEKDEANDETDQID